MKNIAKILFGIFCILVDVFMADLFSAIVNTDADGGFELFVFLLAVTGVFFLIGIYHAITGFSGAMHEKE